MNLRRRLRLPWPFVFATKRISLQIALTVTGRDEYGSIFAERVLTENVSKDGGCLLFRRDLRRMQSFRIEAWKGALSRPSRWCMYYRRRDIPASAFNWIEIRKMSGLTVMRENSVGESLGYRLDSPYS